MSPHTSGSWAAVAVVAVGRTTMTAVLDESVFDTLALMRHLSICVRIALIRACISVVSGGERASGHQCRAGAGCMLQVKQSQAAW